MFFNRKKKISIIGAGNAGCISALHYGYYGKRNFDVTLYYDPQVPIERVGQGTVVPSTGLVWVALNIDWVNNPIGATFKSGIMFEGWGKKRDSHFHVISLHGMAMHYIPWKFSKAVLESGLVNVVEKNISDPEKELDCDYIIDCRGRHGIKDELYDSLINPLNSVLLCNKPGSDPTLTYTRAVATPHGWTFVIPNLDSVSYGYLYNNTITTKEEATEDFIERFDIPEVDGQLNFKNYIAKSVFAGERTLLNGNRLGFVEPLEASALAFYQHCCRNYYDYMLGKIDKTYCNVTIRKEMKQIQNFILWHYQKGSKYDTPFWKYAKSLPFKPDDEFRDLLKQSRGVSNLDSRYLLEHHPSEMNYAQWSINSIKIWDQYVS